jgi:putative transcriptional regulator
MKLSDDVIFDVNFTWVGRALSSVLVEPNPGAEAPEIPAPPIEYPLAAPSRPAGAMSADQVRAIRRRLAKSSREFERRFGVPARTLEGWEQGRRVDVTAAVLLTVIDRNPEAVERAIASTSEVAQTVRGRL